MRSDSDAPEKNPLRGPWRLGVIVAGPFLGLVVYLVLGLVSTDLPEPARRASAVLTWMAVWWLTEAIPLAATSLLPLVLLPLLGILSPRAAAAPYADRIIFLFLGGFILALAMERWNLHRRLALRTILLVGTKPAALVGGFMFATAILSMWMSNTAATLLMLPIGISIIALFEAKSETSSSMFPTCLMLGTAYAASIGGLATPIGSPPNAILISYLREHAGQEISFAQWMMITLPFVLVFLPLMWLLMTRVIFKLPRESIVGGREMIRDELRKLGPMTWPEKCVILVFGLTVFGWIAREPLRALVPALGPWFDAGIDDTSIAIAGAILMFLIPVDLKKGIFVMDWNTASRLPLDVLLLFGGGLSLAAGIQESGLGDAIGQQMQGLSDVPMVVFLGVLVTVSIFLSEVTSNTAQANLMIPILGGVAVGAGIEPLSILIPVTVALSCAFMMPMGTPPNALVFASGRVTIRQMARAGFLINILAIMLVMVLSYTVVPWFVGGIE